MHQTYRRFCYPTGMEPKDRLRKARLDAGFDQPIDAARFFGWNIHTYKSHENGIRGLKLHTARKYAKAFHTSASYLLTGDSPPEPKHKDVFPVPILADAAGGVWLENPDSQSDSMEFVPVVPDPRFVKQAQYARKVRGNSVSRRIRDGEFAIIVKLDSYPGAIPYGALVDVQRERAGLIEHSIKVFQGNRLMTDSTELAEQTAIPLDSGEEDCTVTILGVVIAAHRPL